MKLETATGTISRQNQVTIPQTIRKALNLKAGDMITWVAERGKAMVYPKPKDWTVYTRGIAKGTYGKSKKEVETYLEEERSSWND